MNQEWRYGQRPACCRWLWPLGLAWLACALLALWFGSRSIAGALEQGSKTALSQAGVAVDDIAFSGRDGIITGEVATEAERSLATTAVGRVGGVGSVDNRLVVSGPATTSSKLVRYAPITFLGAAPAALSLTGNGLAQPDIDTLLEQAGLTFGAGNFDSSLTAGGDTGTGVNWSRFGRGLLPTMLTLDAPVLEIANGKATLRGVASSEAKRVYVGAMARGLLAGGAEVDNQIEVGARNDALAAAERVTWTLNDAPSAFLAGEPRGVTPRGGFALAELAQELQAFPDTRIDVGYQSRTGESEWAHDHEGRRLIKEYLSSLGLGRGRIGDTDEIPGQPMQGRTERVVIRLIDND